MIPYNMPYKSPLFYVLYFLLLMTVGADAVPVGTQEIEFAIPNSDRTLVAEIYYPAESGQGSKFIAQGIWQRREFTRNAPLPSQEKPYPLVIFSHGFQGNRFGHAWLAEALVDEGFIVAAIDHTHNTSYEHSAEFIYTSMWQRPLDMSALLDYLLQDPYWSKGINEKKISAGGFSLGGLTALWLTGIEGDPHAFKAAMASYISAEWPESIKKRAALVDWEQAARAYYDPRIRAVFSLAPDLGQGFTPLGLSKAKVPTLIIVGSEDSITPPAQNAAFYAAHMKNTEFMTIKGAGHMSFLNMCSERGKIMTPDLCRDFSHDRAKLHKQASVRIIAFLKQNLLHPEGE